MKSNTRKVVFDVDPEITPDIITGKPINELSDDEICGVLIIYGGDPNYREYINTFSKRKEEIAMALNTARKLKEMGLAVEQIAHVAGLSLDEIKKI